MVAFFLLQNVGLLNFRLDTFVCAFRSDVTLRILFSVHNYTQALLSSASYNCDSSNYQLHLCDRMPCFCSFSDRLSLTLFLVFLMRDVILNNASMTFPPSF